MVAAHGKPFKVLLVEDEPLEAEIVKAILTGGGYDVTHCEDPMDAVHLLEAEAFEFVLSDYVMPRLNGLQVLRRAKMHLPDSIRMIITGKGDYELALQAINRGEVYRFLEKPVNERELLISMRLAGERLAAEQEMARLKAALRERDDVIKKLKTSESRVVLRRHCRRAAADPFRG